MGDKLITNREDYEISPYTFGIIPIEYGLKTYSKIIEFEDELIVPYKPLDVMKASCRYFGSSFDGRCEGTKELLEISHKVPIAVDPGNGLFFFPTTSPIRQNCIWLSYEHIVSKRRLEPNQTQINFRNRKSIVVPVSYSIIENQMMRTAMLKSKLLQKLKETERKTDYLYNFMQVSDGHTSFHSKDAFILPSAEIFGKR